MEEYIKRSEVFEQFDNADADVCETDDFGGVDYGFGMKNIKELINAIPAADVAPVVHGKWIVRFDGPYKRRRCYCSHCGKHNGVGGIAQNQEKPYCPNCGAKMDGGDNDETNGNV